MTSSTLYPWLMPQWDKFCHQKRQGRLPHAILISSIAGLAEGILARDMIASVHCHSFDNDKACGECHSCNLLKADSHPDHLFVAPEEEGKQIKIDQIRSLKEKHILTSTVGKWKTILISPAQNMNNNAFNSLLKLLEEPQENTLIILITDAVDNMPVTIRSRCQSMQLIAPSTDVAQSWIEKNGKLDLSVNIPRLLTLFKGAPLAALNAMESGVDEQIQQVEQDFITLLKGKANPIGLADSWQQYDPLVVLNQLQHFIKDRIIKLTLNTDNKPIKNSVNKVYWNISDCITNTIKLLSTSNNINNTLLLEDFMVSIMETAALERNHQANFKDNFTG